MTKEELASIKKWVHEIISVINRFENIYKDDPKKMFLNLAEKMVETYGFKATLLLLTENFLDEQETGRHDGLIDLPVSTKP